MNGVSEVDYSGLLAKKEIRELRTYFEERPEELFGLFEQCIYQEDWSKDHPDLSLKAFVLLDDETVKSEACQKILRAIVATDVFDNEEQEQLVEEVLQDAIASNHWELIYRLIEQGLSVDFNLENGNTFLHRACSYSMAQQALRLLELGADVEDFNLDGETPLMLACRRELEDVCRDLIKRGADPLRQDNSGHSAVFYALRTGNKDLLRILGTPDLIDWKVEFASCFVRLHDKDKFNEIFESHKDGVSARVFIRRAIKIPHLASYLMEEHREWMEEQIPCIRENSADLNWKHKIVVLPLLLPEEIEKTILLVPDDEIDRWMNTQVYMEAEGDIYSRDTIERALEQINQMWIRFINWDEGDLNEVSARLVVDLTRFLKRIPLKALSAAGIDEDLCPILEACVRGMTDEQLAVVVPHFSLEAYERVMRGLPWKEQTMVLRRSTLAQKNEFIEKVPMPCDQLVSEWHHKGYQELCRRIERTTDAPIKEKIDPKPFFEKLVALHERFRCRLPSRLTQESLMLESFKKALLANSSGKPIQVYIEKEIDPRIEKNRLAIKQLQDITQFIDNHPLKVHRVVPGEFICIFTGEVMKDPVIIHDHRFERASAEQWMKEHSACPICTVPVEIPENGFPTDEALLARITAWKN